MGYPMAGHLARAGHHVTVYNRTAGKAAKWVAQHGGASAPTPAAAACGADLVMMCVGNDDDVRAVALGADGALAGMKPGAILVDHTTASAQVAREIHAAAQGARASASSTRRSRAARPAPRTASSRSWSAATRTTFAAPRALLAHYARAVTLMGGPGSGQLTKMVNQICIAGLVQALAGGHRLRAKRAGLDVERVLDVISKGAAQSWQMENRGKTMVADKFDFGFAVDWMRKDLAICLAEARANGAALPVTALVDQFYARRPGAGRRAAGTRRA